MAVFDTGASNSFIIRSELKKIKHQPIRSGMKEFQSFNTPPWTSKGKVDLEIKYRNNSIMERFWIVEGKETDIILSSKIVKLLRCKKKIPITCKIETNGKGPISWTSPIRCFMDKIEFEKLTQDLEARGIIEMSTSPWLNPVVLTRKRNGDLRF